MAGSEGAAFHPALDVAKIQQVVPKGTDREVDSYSGFFDNGQRKSTGLADLLRQRDVDEVYVMGLATDYCVKATALDARRLGFETTVVEDGCRAVNLTPGDDEAARAELRAAGVKLCTSDQVPAE